MSVLTRATALARGHDPVKAAGGSHGLPHWTALLDR